MRQTELVSKRARWVPDTDNELLIREACDGALDVKGIAVIDGDVGLGKDAIALRWAQEQNVRVLDAQLAYDGPPSEIDTLLLWQLGIELPNSRSKTYAKLHLERQLATEPTIVITGEVGVARPAVLNHMRTHHDRVAFCWIATGRGSLAKLASIGLRDLRSRGGFPYTAKPLEGDDLLDFLSRYHPLYERLNDLHDGTPSPAAEEYGNFLLELDVRIGERDCGPGKPRSWEQFTYHYERQYRHHTSNRRYGADVVTEFGAAIALDALDMNSKL